MIGQIILTVDVEDAWELEKLRHVIRRQYSEGVLSMRAGKAILNFDAEGVLQQINLDVVKWKKEKPSLPLANIQAGFIIEAVVATTSSNPNHRTGDSSGDQSSDGRSNPTL